MDLTWIIDCLKSERENSELSLTSLARRLVGKR